MKEYQILKAETSVALQTEVNIAAQQGWEVVSIEYAPGPYWNEYVATMEREKNESKKECCQ